MGRPPRADAASTRIVGFRLTDEEERRLDELVLEHGLTDRSSLLRYWLAHNGAKRAQDTATSEPASAQKPKRRPINAPRRKRSPKPGKVARVLSAKLADEDVVFGKLNELASREPPGSLISIKTLRELCGLSKLRFDRAVLQLSESSKATIHHHDFAASLSESERAKLVVDQNGTFYVGIAPRKSNLEDSVVSLNETPADALALVSAALREHVDPLGLISVPNVVRALEPRLSKAQVHTALLSLYQQGALELRPEAGSEFLSPQDAALCPPGPRETVLARARWLKQTESNRDPEREEGVSLNETRPEKQGQGALSLKDFAAHVNAAAEASPYGWPIPEANTVLISRLWAELHSRNQAFGLDLKAFKTILTEAYHALHFMVKPCSLVELTDPNTLKDSAIDVRGVSLHLIERNRRKNSERDLHLVLRNIRTLAKSTHLDAVLSIRELRKMCKLSKWRFDVAVFQLRSSEKITLHRHASPRSLPEDEREALVRDFRGPEYDSFSLVVEAFR